MGWLEIFGNFHLAAPLFLLLSLAFFLLAVPFFVRKKEGWFHSNLSWLRKEKRKLFVPALIFLLTVFISGVLILSVAQPKVMTYEQSEMTGKDIIAVIDISGSMFMTMPAEEGLPKDERIKVEIARDAFFEFVRERQKDRVGLMLFSDDPYVLRFFTFDHRLVLENTLLNGDLKDKESKILKFSSGTNIAEALYSAQQIFAKSSKAQGKVVILITDLEEGGYAYAENRNEVMFQEMENILISDMRLYVLGVDVTEEMKQETEKRFTGNKNFCYFDVKKVGDYSRAFSGIDQMEDSIIQVKNVTVEKDIARIFIGSVIVLVSLWMALRLFCLIKIP